MRKVLVNLSVLLLTFLIGCFVQFSLRRAEISHTNAPASNKGQTPTGWRRITIGKVSFSVPPEMKPAGPPGNIGMVQALHSVDGWYLYLFYAYGPSIPTDVNVTASQSQQVTISETPAWIRKWERTEELYWSLDLRRMQLVVSDVGDGNKFELYMVAYDLTKAQRVIDTVEIH